MSYSFFNWWKNRGFITYSSRSTLLSKTKGKKIAFVVGWPWKCEAHQLQAFVSAGVVQKPVHPTVCCCSRMTVPRRAAVWLTGRDGKLQPASSPGLPFSMTHISLGMLYFVSSTPFYFLNIYIYICMCKNEIDQRNTEILVQVFAVPCSQSYCQISLFLFLHGRADRMQLRQEPCVQRELRAGTSFGTVFRNAQTQLPL